MDEGALRASTTREVDVEFEEPLHLFLIWLKAVPDETRRCQLDIQRSSPQEQVKQFKAWVSL